jgi:ATP-grasp domain, R2K clade family 3
MRPFWLIEADVFGKEIECLKAEIRRQSMTFGVVHHDTFTSGYLTDIAGKKLEPNDCVIFVGSWPLWRHIQLHWPGWTPGGWCNTDRLDCAAYYAQFDGFLLNRRHAIMTGVEAISKQAELFEQFGDDDQVFVRPTGCLKVFNGRCVESVSFASALAPSRYDPNTTVLVAQPRRIEREWRFVVANHRPIAASQYHDAGTRCIRQGCPREVWSFVEAVLSKSTWQPDEIFILDVCEADDQLHVLELNGFSCAGLYDCKLAPIVAAAAELAEHA